MRIGIDIGRVIIEGGSQSDRDTDFVQATDVEAIKATKALPGAVEAIKSFVDDGHEVWLISKCKENMQRKSRKWLMHHKFFERTGVNPSRLLFCYHRWDKVVIAEGLLLDVFIDDRIDVLLPMVGKVETLLWFGEKRDFRPANGIVDTRTWDDVMKEMDQWIG